LPGTSSQQLIAISTHNCPDTITKHLIVYPSPNAFFEFIYPQCADTTYTFTSKSSISNGTLSDIWIFGSSAPESGKTVLHSFNSGIEKVKLISVSDKNCPDTFSREMNINNYPQAIESERATVISDSFVLLEWKNSTSAIALKYFVEKSVNSLNFSQIANLNNTTLQLNDFQVYPDKNIYTYRIRTFDSCGNLSEYSNISRTIKLEVDTSQEFPVITWTPYEFWTTGVSDYELQVAGSSKWDSKRSFQKIDDFYSPTVVSDSNTKLKAENYCYRIVAKRSGDQLESVSNEVCIPTICRLFVPNAFSPNGDGLNDIFKPVGIYILNYKMQIFNRWGEKLFDSYDLHKGWDGKFSSDYCPVGVYYYQIQAKGANGKNINKSGSVLLIR